MKDQGRSTTYLLGLDVGTSGLKACILDEKARQVALSRAAYRYFSPRPGWAEIDADSLWNAILLSIRNLRDTQEIDLSRVRGIGFSVLNPCLVLMDETGSTLYDPIPYSDRRSTKQAAEIRERVGAEKLFSITGNGAMAGGLSGSSLLWMRDNQPEAYDKARWFGALNSWLALKMTGQTAIDPTNASYTNLFDTANGERWSEDLCLALDVDAAKLPPLKQSFEPAGSLSCKELTDLGLPFGIPVAIGAGDTPCAALACGVVMPGDVCESAGTSNVLTICQDRPLFDPRFINRAYLIPGTWAAQGSMSFTGAANEWFCREFLNGGDPPDQTMFERANAEAAMAAPGCGGLLFLPYMQGERSPVWDPNARGVFFGLTLAGTRAEMVRAVLESCGYGLRQFLDLSEQLTGRRIERFTSIGGGAKSAVWAQIKADITGRTIDVPEDSDMAAAGAALLAGVCADVWQDSTTAAGAAERTIWRTFVPGHEHSAVYDRNYEIFRQLYPSLKDVFAMAYK